MGTGKQNNQDTITTFEVKRKITICTCYKDCDCKPIEQIKYGVRVKRANGSFKNYEFSSEKKREDFLKEKSKQLQTTK